MANILVRTTNKALPKLHRKIRIETVDAQIYVDLPFAPLEVEYSGFGWNWEEVNREGRSSIVVPGSYKTKTLQFTTVMHARRKPGTPEGVQKPMASIEPEIDKLKRISESKEDVRITYAGGFENRLWHISDFSWKSTKRDEFNNKTTVAEITLAFILSSDMKNYVGPVTGGVKPKTKNSVSSDSTKNSRVSRRHVVAEGETLSSIALKYYRDASKYRNIATANNIKRPAFIEVGTELKIP